MKVWIVYDSYGYEGCSEPQIVFDNEKSAKAFAKRSSYSNIIILDVLPKVPKKLKVSKPKPRNLSQFELDHPELSILYPTFYLTNLLNKLPKIDRSDPRSIEQFSWNINNNPNE